MTPRRLCRGALTPCQAAESKAPLGQHNITHIVNCQDPKSPNFHEKDPAFTYLRFPIAWWFKSPVFKDKGVKVRHSSGACPSRPCASARARAQPAQVALAVRRGRHCDFLRLNEKHDDYEIHGLLADSYTHLTLPTV